MSAHSNCAFIHRIAVVPLCRWNVIKIFFLSWICCAHWRRNKKRIVSTKLLIVEQIHFKQTNKTLRHGCCKHKNPTAFACRCINCRHYVVCSRNGFINLFETMYETVRWASINWTVFCVPFLWLINKVRCRHREICAHIIPLWIICVLAISWMK